MLSRVLTLHNALYQGSLMDTLDASSWKKIEQTLQLDIRTVHQGRGQAVDAAAGQQYSCRFDALTIDFTTYATHVLVTRIEAPKTKERPVAPTAVANARVAAELGMKPSSAL